MTDTTAHDNLAFILATALARFAGGLADAAIAKGWRPPPRIIVHVDELIALPDGSVVLHSPCSDVIGSSCVWVKGVDWWMTTHIPGEFDSYDLDSHCDDEETLTVLWTPDEAKGEQ
jgi:hypothetical protein